MTIKVIEFDPVLFSEEAVVSDKEIEDYYEMHKSDFQQKSQIDLKYFVLGINDVMDKINLREKELTNYYENNANDEFSTKASFHSRHIMIATPQDKNTEGMEQARQRAESVYQQLLTDRKKFPELAKIYSEDPGSARNGGDLGWVEKGSFVAEFEAAVENLNQNELSRPFLSNFGYHIVEVLEKKGAAMRPFADVKDEIEQKIRSNKAKRRLSSQVAKLLENTAEKSIEDLAQSVNKTVVQTGEFDDAKDLKDIGNSNRLYQELNGKTKSYKGQYNLEGEEQIVVFEIVDTREPFVKPLAEVREQVKYFSKEEMKAKLAKERLTHYAFTIKSAVDFEKLAIALKTKTKSIVFKFSDRQAGDLRTGNKFKTDVFKMEKDQISAIQDLDRGYLVYLVEKKPGELNDKSLETLTALEDMMQGQKSQVVLNGLINKLQKETQIDYNQPLLKALNVNFES
jgi:peptidyl-prolyl cis-trans isomerase D